MEYLKIEANPERFHSMMDFVLEKPSKLEQWNARLENELRIACEEIFVNVISYAYPDKESEVIIGIEISGDEIVISVMDKGIPFNPLEKEPPDITTSIEEREIGGLGIFIVKNIMDNIAYRRENQQNILTMRKKVQQEKLRKIS